MADLILILQLRMDSKHLSLLYTFYSLNVVVNCKANPTSLVRNQVKVIWLATAYTKKRENSLRFETVDSFEIFLK